MILVCRILSVSAIIIHSSPSAIIDLQIWATCHPQHQTHAKMTLTALFLTIMTLVAMIQNVKIVKILWRILVVTIQIVSSIWKKIVPGIQTVILLPVQAVCLPQRIPVTMIQHIVSHQLIYLSRTLAQMTQAAIKLHQPSFKFKIWLNLSQF